MRQLAYLELTKPRLTGLAVLSAGAGYALGSMGACDWPRLGATLLGAALVGGGGNALNEWLEREQDALMRRTRRRPLPSGRVAPRPALWFGTVTSLAGVVVLSRVNPLAAGLGVLTLISYVGIYTPLKRITPLCTLVGAVPGAMPPLIGWAAAVGALSVEAWILCAVLFLWQLPHFLAIAWMYRDDYAAAGFRMLPVIDAEGSRTGRQMVLYALALLPASLLPTLVGLSGPVYFCAALAVGAWFVALALLAAWSKSLASARRLFLGSIGYLPLMLLLMVLDRGAR